MNTLIDNRKNSILIFFAAATLGLGLGYESSNIIFAFADLLLIASLFLMISKEITKEFRLIIISFFISFLTILYAISFNPYGEFERPFLSLVYFYKPYLAFFLGYIILNTKEKLEKFFISYLCFSIFIVLIVFYKVIIQSAPWNLGYFFHEISIIGANGRNAYFVMVTISAMIGTTLFLSSNKYKVFIGSYTLISSLLICISNSRQSIIALLVFYFCIGTKLLFEGKKSQKRLVLLIALICFFAILLFWKTLLGFWGNKFYRGLTVASNFDFNYFSNGRLVIYDALIKDIIESPFLGTAFKSYPSYIAELANSQGLSPHNQYLGAYWKMGLMPFVFYMYFLGALYYGVWKLYNTKKDLFYYGIFIMISVILFVLAFFQDVLLTPLSGIIFSLICGSCLSILKDTNNFKDY